MSKKNNKKEQSQEQSLPPEQELPETGEAAEAQTQPPQAEDQAEPEPAQVSEADELRQTLAEANDKYLRMLAEYDNYRRRSQKERENIYADVRADTVKKFLPVYDNLARAAQHETDDETRKGVEGIFNQLKTILEGLGVTEIPTVGKKFDPALHDALLHVEDEKYGEGEIVQELEKGFMLGERVIRFAKVQVAN